MADQNTPVDPDAPVATDVSDELAAETAVAEELSHEPSAEAGSGPVTETGSEPAAESGSEPVAETETGSEALAEAGSEPVEEVVPAEVTDEAAPPEPLPAAMPSAELRAVVEALIFASPEPITPRTLYKLLANESKDDVSTAVNELRQEYLNRPGLQMVEVAGGYQITTRPELHEWVRRLFHERSTQKLSVAALESLAVIAYKQPVTALEVTEIRGVNASGVLSTLLERNLIKIVGRKNVVGRPFMYGTTKEFLIRFGLKDLGDLPRIEDMADALGFDPPAGLIERTPKEEMLPLDETEEGSPASDADPTATSEEPPDPEAS
jgi:segregation and condensation protein B